MAIKVRKTFAALSIVALGAATVTFIAPAPAHAAGVDVSLQVIREEIQRFIYVCDVHRYCSQDWHHLTMDNARLRQTTATVMGAASAGCEVAKQAANDIRVSARMN